MLPLSAAVTVLRTNSAGAASPRDSAMSDSAADNAMSRRANRSCNRCRPRWRWLLSELNVNRGCVPLPLGCVPPGNTKSRQIAALSAIDRFHYRECPAALARSTVSRDRDADREAPQQGTYKPGAQAPGRSAFPSLDDAP